MGERTEAEEGRGMSAEATMGLLLKKGECMSGFEATQPAERARGGRSKPMTMVQSVDGGVNGLAEHALNACFAGISTPSAGSSTQIPLSFFSSRPLHPEPSHALTVLVVGGGLLGTVLLVAAVRGVAGRLAEWAEARKPPGVLGCTPGGIRLKCELNPYFSVCLPGDFCRCAHEEEFMPAKQAPETLL